ncbi:MAG TPA: hypothetical protein VG755_23210 [Nannocystaceae bacterium]|nr:hypothetical protein [Nannocystaceae bacterium]
MYLVSAELENVPPFGTIELPFCDEHGRPRLLTVVHGAGGVGKTVLLSAIGATRPGNATVLFGGALGAAPQARCQWHLGVDDPERPHPLSVATPSQSRPGEDDAIVLRRREQALFERRAKDGGFVFATFPTIRWFSRQPVALHAPTRTVAHYDVRATVNLDDANRSDLTRETKQALAYAAIAAALVPHGQRERNELRERSPLDMRLLGAAMRDVVDALVRLAGFSYLGVDPVSLEPCFASAGTRRLPFDGLPTRARHLVAIASLSVRTLWAAYPGTDPRTAEGAIAIDDIDLYQDSAVQEAIAGALRAALPRVQWILTTSSPIIASACDAREILTLRRLPGDEHVELFVDEQARTH